MINIGKAHILALVSHLRSYLPSHVFGITVRFAPMPAMCESAGAKAFEITTTGLYDDEFLLHDVVTWIECEPLESDKEFADEIDETARAHEMAHQRTQDEIDAKRLGIAPHFLVVSRHLSKGTGKDHLSPEMLELAKKEYRPFK